MAAIGSAASYRDSESPETNRNGKGGSRARIVSASIGITEVRKRVTAEFPVMTVAVSPGSVSLAVVQRRTAMQKVVAAIAVSTASTGLPAVRKRLASELPVMTFALSPGSVTFAMVQKRTAMQKAVSAFASSPEAVGIAEVLKVVITRHPLVVSPSVELPAAAFASMLSREPRDVPLLAMSLSPPQQSLVMMLVRGAPGKALAALGTSPPSLSSTRVLKGAAMPPEMVMGLMLILAGHRTLRIMWLQPGLGTGILLHYEYTLDGGTTWISTMSPSTEYIITGLAPGTSYTISVRAVTNVGRGPASAALTVSTLSTTTPSVPQFFRTEIPGGGAVDLVWVAPADDGGDDITRYEVQVTDPNGVLWPVDATDGPVLIHRVRGLQVYQRYGFQVRARNSVGASPWTGILYAIPIILPVVAVPPGQRIPLLDLDRQSLIVRLAGQDCRIRVWWQPSDSSWFSSMEVPVNSPAVTGRRVAVGAGLLDRLPDVLAGNVVCRAIDEDSGSHDPERTAWARQTHGLYWIPN